MESDIRIEKFLDILMDEMRAQLGDGAEKCPIYRWIGEVLLEVRSENNTRLLSEIPIPPLSNPECVMCPVSLKR